MTNNEFDKMCQKYDIHLTGSQKKILEDVIASSLRAVRLPKDCPGEAFRQRQA